MDEIAQAMMDRFERSSGVRATLVYGGQREILRRDGGRRILPFNLLLDADPPQFELSAWHPRLGLAEEDLA